MQLFVASVLLLASGACAHSAKFGDLYRDAVFVAPVGEAPLGRWLSADEAAIAGVDDPNCCGRQQFSSHHAPLRSKLVSPAGLMRFATRAGFAPEAVAADAVAADGAIAENNVVFVKSPFAPASAEGAWRKADAETAWRKASAETAWRKAGAIPITNAAAEAFADDEYAIAVPEASKYGYAIPADATVLRTSAPSHLPALRHPGLIARAFPSLAAPAVVPSFQRTQFGAAEPSVFLKSLKSAQLIPTAAGKLSADVAYPAAARLFANAPFVADETLAAEALVPAPARFVKAFEGEEEAVLPGAVRFAPRFQHAAAAPEAFKYKLVAVPARAAEAQESGAFFADEAAFPAGVVPLKRAIATPFF